MYDTYHDHFMRYHLKHLDIVTLQEKKKMANESYATAIRMCKETTTIETIIDLTKHEHPQVRKRALREMCPCRVKKDHTDFWNRVFEMMDDEDKDVRQQVLHTLCDGSPAHLEYAIAEALEKFNHDTDTKIRRMAHKCLTSYRKTGKWNIL